MEGQNPKQNNNQNNDQNDKKNIEQNDSNKNKDNKLSNVLENKQQYERLYSEQQDQIQKEIEQECLISKQESLFELMKEYEKNNQFLYKILDLMQNYKKSFIKRSRKDGSCFYRCFLFRLAELLIEKKENFGKFKIFEKLQKSKEILIKANYQEIVFKEFQFMIKNFFISIQNGTINKDNLLSSLNDKYLFDNYVMFLRMLISAYIRVNFKIYEVYFESEYHFDHFCKNEVEPIDSETDQIQITALNAFFEIPFRIFQIDNSSQKSATCLSIPDVQPNTVQKVISTNKDYPIQFLHKPGHYDLIY